MRCTHRPPSLLLQASDNPNGFHNPQQARDPEQPQDTDAAVHIGLFLKCREKHMRVRSARQLCQWKPQFLESALPPKPLHTTLEVMLLGAIFGFGGAQQPLMINRKLSKKILNCEKQLHEGNP